MWAVSSNQQNVPGGFVRVEQVADGFARMFEYVSLTSSVRKGTVTPTTNGVEGADAELIELDLALSGRIPLPIGGVSLGGGFLTDMENGAGDAEASLSGLGVRASVALIAQFSLDLAHSWVSGTVTEAGLTADASGTRTALGGTLLIWGLNQFRFGVSVSKTWTDVDSYESEGYSYQFVSTMY